jgi:DNA helicase-2/ATP-dependent DNA helicase PcrA
MDDGNYVTLATIHAVKGLEFKAVIVCGLEDNILPSTRSHDNDDTLEEERRLMYVAVTRAKQRLYLTRSKSRYLYGRREPTLRSRFLKELSSVVELPQAKPAQRGYYSDEDPDFYGNATYGAGRFSGGKSYGGYGSSYGGSSYGNSRGSTYGGSSYGGGYGSTYGGKTYGSSTYTSEKPTSSPTRTTTYGSGTYGSASYGAKPAAAKPAGASGAAAYAFGGGAKPTGTKDVSVFKEGVRVSHPKFGQGTIIGVRGTAANTIVNVAFDGLGVKQLSAALAPLTIVK